MNDQEKPDTTSGKLDGNQDDGHVPGHVPGYVPGVVMCEFQRGVTIGDVNEFVETFHHDLGVANVVTYIVGKDGQPPCARIAVPHGAEQAFADYADGDAMVARVSRPVRIPHIGPPNVY